MANIHGMGDYDNEAPRRNNNQQNNQAGPIEAPEFLRAFQVGGNDRGDPRKEGFCEMLKNNLTAPAFGMKYFIAIVSIVDILSYIITLVASFFQPTKLNDAIFLGINSKVLKPWQKDSVEIATKF